VLVVHGDIAEPRVRPGYSMLKRFPRPSNPGRSLTIDVCVRTDLFRDQLARFLEREDVELPELPPAALATVTRLLGSEASRVECDPEVLAQLETWLRGLDGCLDGAGPESEEYARVLHPWLEVLETRTAELRATKDPADPRAQ
jgi:hypothetical protein